MAYPTSKPWGLRHAGDKGNLYRWDQCLTDVRGFQWKDLAQQRAVWKRVESSFLDHFCHAHKRKREVDQSTETPTPAPERETKRDCQVPHVERTHGGPRKQRESEVPSRVSTLKVRYKRKYTRQGDTLKEYLVPLGTSDECAPGQQGIKTRGAHLAQELKRQKNSSSWTRAIREVGDDQPLIDLLVRPTAGGQQGGHDIFGLPARLESRSAGRGGTTGRSGAGSQPPSKDANHCGNGGSTLSKCIPGPHPRRLHQRMPTSPIASTGQRGGERDGGRAAGGKSSTGTSKRLGRSRCDTNGDGESENYGRRRYETKAETKPAQRRRKRKSGIGETGDLRNKK